MGERPGVQQLLLVLPRPSEHHLERSPGKVAPVNGKGIDVDKRFVISIRRVKVRGQVVGEVNAGREEKD